MQAGDNQGRTLLTRIKRRARREATAAWNTRARPVGSFTLGDQRYRYRYAAAHETWRTERAVEIPVAIDWIESAAPGSRILEVGNVLHQYARSGSSGRLIVDKYERGQGVKNLDVLSVDGTFDLIVSVSTLEHVGLDESPRDPGKAAAGVAHLRSLLAPGGRMLATWALQYNRDLDDALREGRLAVSAVRYLKRQTRSRWDEVDVDDAFHSLYGYPFLCGNVVAFVEWLSVLRS